MEFLAFGAFVVVVAGLTWVSTRRRQRITSCCAPADPRDDLRMRGAFGDERRGPSPPSESSRSGSTTC
jgi:hypothetical protein